MAIELKKQPITFNFETEVKVSAKVNIKDILQTRKAGHTIGMLIAERKNNRSNKNHQERMNMIINKLIPYEGILADPFNKQRRLNITRLIACIDGK